MTVDEFLYVDAYPPPDAKRRISGRERQCGGLTGTALIAAARLGAKCAYAGRLGDDELSAFIIANMEREGVDVSHVVRRKDAVPLYAVIIVDTTAHTRNIFYHVPGTAGAAPEEPAEEFIRAAKVLFVDQYGMEGMIRAARIAREAGVGVVADFEHSAGSARFPELLALVDHPLLPLEHASELTGKSDPAAAAGALWGEGVDTVAVTCGTQGSFYVSKDAPGEVRHQPAFAVETVDTTGCGDVFHGAYAAALARGVAVDERMRLASAAAAIKATQPGGQKGIPTLPVVEDFLARHKA